MHAAVAPTVHGARGESGISQQNRQRIIYAPCEAGRILQAAGDGDRSLIIGGHILRRLASPALAGASLLAGLFVTDWVIKRWDLNFAPMRSRANDDRVLTRPEFSVRVVTNALGFREPRLPAPKPPGTVRIVAIGDSFTQGYGVNESEAYPRQLEALLGARDPARHYEVINLGVPGACPPDYLYNLREVGLAYHPDVVLVGLMANDVGDIDVRHLGHPSALEVLQDIQKARIDHRPAWKRLPSLLWPALYDFVGDRARPLKEELTGSDTASARDGAEADPPPALRPTVPPEHWRGDLVAVASRFDRRAQVESALAAQGDELIGRLAPILAGGWSFVSPDWTPYFTFMGLVQPDIYADGVLLPPRYDTAWNMMIADLRQIDAVAGRAGARTVIVFIPTAYQVTPAAWRFFERYGIRSDERTLTDTSFADRLKRFGAAYGIPVVDLLPLLRSQANRQLYFIRDGHWTPEGHALAAAELADALRPVLPQ
jgi:lysophospholipase L1-like esterase